MKNIFFKYLVVFLFLKLLPGVSIGQQLFRIKADFSIKEKQANGSSQLIIGSVYYDRNVKKLVYLIKFPKPETWVIEGNMLYKLKGNQVVSKQTSLIFPDQSIFHYALSGQLAHYGLKNTFYKMEDAKKEGNMIVSTWLPDQKYRKTMGKVVMSNINRNLYGIVTFSPGNEIISKQFFKNYVLKNGCAFPTDITQINYLKLGENYQLTTYKNIVIDAQNEQSIYNFNIPK